MTFATDVAAMQARATTVLAQADSYLTSLLAQANVVLIDGTTSLPEQYDYNSVPQVSFPVFQATRPVISTSTIQPPEAPSTSFTSLTNISLPVDDLLAPTGEFAYAEQPYISTLLDPLKAKLLDNLLNGGYGIETADEIALFNRARDREVEAMMSRVDDAGRAMASRGFPLPPGELSIHVDRAYQELQDKTSSVSRDITLERAKLYVENRQFTIREIRELEQITMNYWNSVNERALNVAKASVEMSIALYNALLERFKTRMAGAKITADVNIASAQIDVSRATSAFEIFRSKIAGYEAQLRSITEPGRLAVDVYRADVENARTLNDGYTARASLQQKVLEATKQQNIDISRMTIENARARLQGTIEQLRFRTAAAQYGAEKFFAQLTAIETTVNALTVESATA